MSEQDEDETLPAEPVEDEGVEPDTELQEDEVDQEHEADE